MERKCDYTLLQYQTIEWLRFPLAVAVVFIHSFGYPAIYTLPTLSMQEFSGMDIYNIIRICFSHVVTHVAVPTFFLISGFLFFNGKADNLDTWAWWKMKYKRRFRTLVIPYFLWNLIAILSVLLVIIGTFFLSGKPLSRIFDYFVENHWLHLFWDSEIWGEDRLNWLGLAVPSTAPVNVPLWFLRDLLVTVVIAPVIYWLVKYLKYYYVFILAFCYVSKIWFDIPGLSITAIFFFSLGAFYSIRGINLVMEFKKIKLISFVGGVPLLLITIYFDGNNTAIGFLLYPFFIIMGVCATFNLAVCLVESGKVKVYPVLSKSAFFIYATHALLVLFVSQLICSKILYWNNPVILTLRYFLTPVLAVGICLTLYFVMKKRVPKLLGVLTGGRLVK